jgi:hypothetical protein
MHMGINTNARLVVAQCDNQEIRTVKGFFEKCPTAGVRHF